MKLYITMVFSCCQSLNDDVFSASSQSEEGSVGDNYLFPKVKPEISGESCYYVFQEIKIAIQKKNYFIIIHY